MEKKILMFLFLGMFLISLVSGVEFLGTYKQNEDVSLIQSGASLTECNITSVKYPDSTTALENVAMTFRNNEFNYTFTDTENLGTYIVNGFCGNTTDYVYWAYDFDITPSGQGGTSNIYFSIFIILMIYGITFTGFFGRNIPITILGGMAMMFLGVYLVTQGVIIYRDDLTNYLAYLTLGLGVITTFWAIFEQFEVFN